MDFLYKYFKESTKMLLSKYRRSSIQEQSPNIGTNREVYIKDFLESIIPPRLEVRSGELIDNKGNRSGQLDVILVRNDTPHLSLEGEDTYLITGAFCAIEIKSNLNKEKLLKATETLSKVEALNKPSVQILIGYEDIRIYNIVIAYEGSTLGSLSKHLSGDCIDMVCVLNKGILIKKDLLLQICSDFTEYKAESNNFVSVNNPASALAFLFLLIDKFSPTLMYGESGVENYFISNQSIWNATDEI